MYGLFLSFFVWDKKGIDFLMLLELHVENLALIEREDISFEEGLNILTG